MPTAARIPPRMTHGRWSIMKLDAGQWTRPVPWPTHSNPINMAAMPMISKTDFMMAPQSLFCALSSYFLLTSVMGGKRTSGWQLSAIQASAD